MCASGGKQLCLVFVCSSRFILHMLSVYHWCWFCFSRVFFFSSSCARLHALTYTPFVIKYIYKSIKLCDLIKKNRFEIWNVRHVPHPNVSESSSLKVWHNAFSFPFYSLSIPQNNWHVFKHVEEYRKVWNIGLAFLSVIWLWLVWFPP